MLTEQRVPFRGFELTPVKQGGQSSEFLSRTFTHSSTCAAQRIGLQNQWYLKHATPNMKSSGIFNSVVSSSFRVVLYCVVIISCAFVFQARSGWTGFSLDPLHHACQFSSLWANSIIGWPSTSLSSPIRKNTTKRDEISRDWTLTRYQRLFICDVYETNI